MATIASVGTAVPRHVLTREEVRQTCLEIFRDLPDLERLIEVVDHAGVERRHLCFPPMYYLQPRDFEERNLDYQAQACLLGEEAIRGCLEPAGLDPTDIDHLIFVTTTGLATPSIDALLAHRMKMRPELRRTPIFGVGCAGGVVGLARAATAAEERPGQRVVLLSVELCGQTLQLQDVSRSNLVGAALFGDGAAAVLVTSGGRSQFGARVVRSASHLFPDSAGVMGWRFHSGGLELRLQQDVPGLVRRELPPLVQMLLEPEGLEIGDIDHYVFHPGGAKVLAAYRTCLGIREEKMEPARRFLHSFGNLSSASVLFILKSIFEEATPREGDLGLMLALGPGFAAEQLLLRWSGAGGADD
jgi:alkylresorcinol/alkylpyrone synthase